MSSNRYSFPAGYQNAALIAGASKYVPNNGFQSAPYSPSSGNLAPGAVNLGGAGNFEILAKTGITNVPSSVVGGNMGVSPAAASSITGFTLVLDSSGHFYTSAQVSGIVTSADLAYPPAVSALTQAVLDMQAAYTDAQTRTPINFANEGAGNIGGLSLTPGIHNWTTGVTAATNVTLNGGPNDVFIMQIAGTLALTGGANILLTGGVQEKNIFWAVGGTVSIGAASFFRGTILGQTSITMVTGSKNVGRLLAQTLVALQANPVIVAPGGSINSISPVVPARIGPALAFMPGA